MRVRYVQVCDVYSILFDKYGSVPDYEFCHAGILFLNIDDAVVSALAQW